MVNENRGILNYWKVISSIISTYLKICAGLETTLGDPSTASITARLSKSTSIASKYQQFWTPGQNFTSGVKIQSLKILVRMDMSEI